MYRYCDLLEWFFVSFVDLKISRLFTHLEVQVATLLSLGLYRDLQSLIKSKISSTFSICFYLFFSSFLWVFNMYLRLFSYLISFTNYFHVLPSLFLPHIALFDIKYCNLLISPSPIILLHLDLSGRVWVVLELDYIYKNENNQGSNILN